MTRHREIREREQSSALNLCTLTEQRVAFFFPFHGDFSLLDAHSISRNEAIPNLIEGIFVRQTNTCVQY